MRRYYSSSLALGAGLIRIIECTCVHHTSVAATLAFTTVTRQGRAARDGVKEGFVKHDLQQAKRMQAQVKETWHLQHPTVF